MLQIVADDREAFGCVPGHPLGRLRVLPSPCSRAGLRCTIFQGQSLLKYRNSIPSAIHLAQSDLMSTLPPDQQAFRSAGRGLFGFVNGFDGIAAQPQTKAKSLFK